MGIISKLITTAAVNSVIKTAGNVTLSTATGIIDSLGARDNCSAQTAKAPNKSDLVGEHYEIVRSAFYANGFTNISLIPQRDIINGFFIKDGTVEEITICGKSDYKKKKHYATNSPVVIIFHTYRNQNKPTMPIESAPTRRSILPPTEPGAQSIIYCSYCGSPQDITNVFCIRCGKQLKK